MARLSAKRPPFGAVAVGVCVLAGLAAGYRTLLEPGVIGLIRDWAVPPAGGQMAAFALQTFDGWYTWTLGLPAIYPTDYLLEFAIGLGGALGMQGGAFSKCVVLLGPALGCGSAIFLGRRLGLGATSALACGLVYALNPVVLNKLVSGQISFIFGYAFFPLALGAYVAACDSGRWLRGGMATGACFALAAFQIQLGFIDVLLVTVAAVALRFGTARARLAALFVSLASLAIIELPVLIGLRSNFGTLLGVRTGIRSDVDWIAQNSAPPSEALKLAGYIVQYDLHAVAGWYLVWSVAAYAIAGVALLGLLRARRGVRELGLLTGLAALLVVTGVYSPIAPALLWLFGHVAYSHAFVELYDVMSALALVYALGVGYFWEAFGTRQSLVRALAGLALAVFVAPLLSGDCGGLLRAHPYDRDLLAAYGRLSRESRRIVWFPMDQPLSFRGDGAGVEPMGVTASGSLWKYSLSWPLTAVDMDARSEDWDGLVRALDALSVGSVVQRSDFASKLYQFLLGAGRHTYLERRVYVPRLSAVSAKVGSATRVDTLEGGLPIAFAADGLAFVPRRLAAISAFAATGAVAVAFEPWIPTQLPYVVMRDPGNAADEATAYAGIDEVGLPTSTIFATQGFAPLSWWWWYRPEFSDVTDGVLALGPNRYQIAVPRSLRDGIVEVSWIATPVGGRFRLAVHGRARTIDTNASHSMWRSSLVPVGAIAAGEALTIDALDPAAVAIRGIRIVDAAELARANSGYALLLRRARFAGTWAFAERRFRPIRTGTTPELGQFAFRHRYRLVVSYVSARGGYAGVVDPKGNPAAFHRLRGGSREEALAFDGVSERLKLDLKGGRLRRWSLWTSDGVPAVTLPHAVTALFRAEPSPGESVRTTALFRAPRRVAVLNVAYSESWRSDPEARHFPTALGTNAWVSGTAAQLRVGDRQTPLFNLAFVVGIAAFALAIVCSASTIARRPAPDA